MDKSDECKMYDLARQLWSINRSLTGSGVRQTLGILKGILPTLNIFEIASGTSVFDWVVPTQ